RAQALVDGHPKLTSLTSSLDAVEMNLDPVFVVNHDMAEDEVLAARTAVQVFECHGRPRSHADRRLELADGRVIDIPSQEDLADPGTPEVEYIADPGDIRAQIAEQPGSGGEPVVVVDPTAELFHLVDLFNGTGHGCGCASTSGGAGAAAAVGLAALAVRRRRG